MNFEKKQTIPACQTLLFVIKRLNVAIAMLEKIEADWQVAMRMNKDGCNLREQSQVLVDTISMYISVLVDTRKGTHSLINSFLPNEFVNKFTNSNIVQKCKMKRNNRGAHESKFYGFTITPDDILNSDIKQLVISAEIFIVNTPN